MFCFVLFYCVFLFCIEQGKEYFKAITIWTKSKHKKLSKIEQTHQQRCMFLLFGAYRSKHGEPYFDGITQIAEFIVRQRYNQYVHSLILFRHSNNRSTTRDQYKKQYLFNQEPMARKIIREKKKMIKDNEFCTICKYI